MLTFDAFWGYPAHMKTQQSLPLKHAEATPCTIHINGRCNYREEGELRVIFANGIPLFHYALGDKAANQYAMIHLVESGLANQQEVAAAFNCSRLTIFRSTLRKSPQNALPVLAVYMGHSEYKHTIKYLKVIDAEQRQGLLDAAASQKEDI